MALLLTCGLIEMLSGFNIHSAGEKNRKLERRGEERMKREGQGQKKKKVAKNELTKHQNKEVASCIGCVNVLKV